jgi:magnesium-transporting ATPase (P-type)
MLQKKNGKDWHIGLIHFLFAGIIYPYGIGLLFVLISVFILNLDIDFHNKELLPYIFISTITNAIVILGIWLGNGRFINIVSKSYYIKEKNWILVYSFVFYVLYVVIQLLRGEKNDMPPINILFTVLELFLYYIIGKKYIVKTVSKEQ